MTIKLQDIYGLAKTDIFPAGGTQGQVMGVDAGGDPQWVDPAKGKIWKIITANTLAAVGDALLVDTTAAPVTVTLPAAPVLGDEIWFEDVAGNFGTNKLVVAQGGNPIMGLAEDMDVEMNNAMFGLVFADATNGWRII